MATSSDVGAVVVHVCAIDVSPVDEIITVVESNGGSVVVLRISIRGVGWLAHLRDTERNVFGTMQSGENAK